MFYFPSSVYFLGNLWKKDLKQNGNTDGSFTNRLKKCVDYRSEKYFALALSQIRVFWLKFWGWGKKNVDWVNTSKFD